MQKIPKQHQKNLKKKAWLNWLRCASFQLPFLRDLFLTTIEYFMSLPMNFKAEYDTSWILLIDLNMPALNTKCFTFHYIILNHRMHNLQPTIAPFFSRSVSRTCDSAKGSICILGFFSSSLVNIAWSWGLLWFSSISLPHKTKYSPMMIMTAPSILR